MISYEGAPPVPLLPRAIAQLYVNRYDNYAEGLQARWLRQNVEVGLGYDFSTEVFEAAESTLKDYFIDNNGDLDPAWADMVEGGAVDNLRLDFVKSVMPWPDPRSSTAVKRDLSLVWAATPHAWPPQALWFADSSTEVFFCWIVWHMHWLHVSEMLRSITEFKWRLHE